MPQELKNRYSDAELEEFKVLIKKKIDSNKQININVIIKGPPSENLSAKGLPITAIGVINKEIIVMVLIKR